MHVFHVRSQSPEAELWIVMRYSDSVSVVCSPRNNWR